MIVRGVNVPWSLGSGIRLGCCSQIPPPLQAMGASSLDEISVCVVGNSEGRSPSRGLLCWVSVGSAEVECSSTSMFSRSELGLKVRVELFEALLKGCDLQLLACHRE